MWAFELIGLANALSLMYAVLIDEAIPAMGFLIGCLFSVAGLMLHPRKLSKRIDT